MSGSFLTPLAPLTRGDLERWATDTAKFAAEYGALDLLAKAVAAFSEREAVSTTIGTAA